MFSRTPRLLLRPGWAEDAPALTRAIGQEAVVRNLAHAPWPYTLDDARSFLALGDDPQLPRFLVFARTGGAPRLVGGVGIGRDPDGALELGYWIERMSWGLGYATEACRAVLDIARSIDVGPLVAGHFLDNPASGRVLRKLGFRPTGRIVQRHSVARGGSAACALYAEEGAACDIDMRCLRAA